MAMTAAAMEGAAATVTAMAAMVGTAASAMEGETETRLEGAMVTVMAMAAMVGVTETATVGGTAMRWRQRQLQ